MGTNSDSNKENKDIETNERTNEREWSEKSAAGRQENKIKRELQPFIGFVVVLMIELMQFINSSLTHY